MADPFQMFKYVYSTILLIFSLVLILGVVFTRQTHLSKDVHPALAIVVLVITISWLTMVEGGQGALVGLTPVDPILYEKTHKWTRMCTKLVYTGDNLDRYLLGRQFMVILIVFSVEMSGAATEYEDLWGLPTWLSNIFLVSGLAMILFTCMVGQLNSEINGCHCMLDYLNNWLGIFTVWVALAIEFSGLLHFTYIIQHVVSAAAGKPIESNEPPRNFFQQIFFYGRCLFSLGALIFAFTIVLGALFQGKSKMWDSVPPAVSVVIFFVLLFIIGQLEASQIAYFAVTKLRECERGDAMFAKLTCAVIFAGDGRNLQAFIIGRQLCVVSCMFFVARITSVQLEEGDPNILGVPDWVQGIVDTGLLGALCVAIIGSMMWRLLAASFPIFFLSFPVTYILLRWCMLLEYTGIMHGAWVLAALHKKIAGFKRDEVYIGTAEDRAAMKRGDGKIVIGPGHVTSVPEMLANPLDFTDDRSKILSNIKNLHDLMGMSVTTDAEKQIYQRSLAQEVAHLERINKEHGKALTASKHGTDPVSTDTDEELAIGKAPSEDYV